ncbi:transcription factor GTE6-like [Rutidosis leptorrhynchoides]|uniref:transcription factor GTE6-like n=1 Tax=Rutidosis leptorrhynchoides TaxID=125765 RepID=UPI003A99ECB6
MEAQIEVRNGAMVAELHQNVDKIFVNIDKLEQRVNEVERFYSSTNKKRNASSKACSIIKEKDKDKQITGVTRRQLDTSCREAAATKRMQDLMHQFTEILHLHIMGHTWAGPFMQPVDVVGLGLKDYHEVIEKPMDFSTIKNKMDAKDGSGYKNVREICADVRLVFKNAMKYNDERDDVHVMAKTLLVKFEEKWLQILPKVIEEDERRKKEEPETRLNVQLAQEIAHAKMARDLSTELNELDIRLQELREVVLRNCRKMSVEEKKSMVKALTQLTPEDLDKALLIIAQNDPNFEATSNEIELDMDTQSESILWKLKFFMKDMFQSNEKGATSIRTVNKKRKQT